MKESILAEQEHERLWLQQLQAGSEQAFAKLIARHHRQMVMLAAGIVGTSQAEEVVQEAWISVHKNIARFEGRSTLKTWIYTIVSNAARTRLRSEKRHRHLSLDETGSAYGDHRYDDSGHWQQPPPQWDIDSPDGLLEEDQLRHCIEKTLLKLPSTQKAVFSLRDIEQLSLQEICNILDVSESNVRVLLHRARVSLMQVIDQYQETGTC